MQKGAGKTDTSKNLKRYSDQIEIYTKPAKQAKLQSESQAANCSQSLNITDLSANIIEYRTISLNDEDFDLSPLNPDYEVFIREDKNENLLDSAINEDQVDHFLFDNFDFLAEEFKKRHTFDLL